jgi:hypothetical protein
VRAEVCRADSAEHVVTARPPLIGWRKKKVIGEMRMSTAVMTERIAGASPRVKARIAGVFYVLTGFTAVFNMFFVLGRLVVSGDAAATATNILAHEPLFWLGFTAALINVASQIVLVALFYDLFKPVSRTLSLLAALFLLMECAVLAFGSLFQLAPLLILGDGGFLNVFKVEQVQALALLFLNLNAQTFDISLVFFGFFCVLIGYLIFRSTFLPRVIGVLMMLAGLGYLTFLSPPLATYLSPYNLAPAALGEPSLFLWLLVAGVNAQRWKEQASAATIMA